jgi:predicted ArsR family transcriptional regulator
VRRGPGAGKPAVVYELRSDAEALFSRAYPPVLRALVDAIVRELPGEQTDRLLRCLGHELAQSVGGEGRGDIEARVRAAAAVLTQLGGDVEVVGDAGGFRIQGHGCPLAAAVADHPEVCRAVETLVGDVAGVTMRSECKHGARPRCCFVVEPGSNR